MANKENKGKLKTWKDDRGFGFIKPDDGSDDLFIHISALKGSMRRPYRGDVIYYHIEQDDNGKYKAARARIEGVENYLTQKKLKRRKLWIVAIFLVLVCLALVSMYFLDYPKG